MLALKIGGAVFQAVVCLAVGISMLRSAIPERRVPDILLAGCVLSIGVVAGALFAFASATEVSAPRMSQATAALAIAMIDASVLVLYEFGRRVFRPQSKVALAVLFGLVVADVVSLVGIGITSGFVVSALGGVWGVLGIAVTQVVLAALGVDCWRHHRMVSRRAQLGMADPITANRFFLLALVCGAGTIAALAPLATSALGGGAHDSPVAVAVVFLMQVVWNVSLWMAFAPPKAFLEHVRARSARAVAIRA